MAAYLYELQWPRDNLRMDIFAHEICNYRYHWHHSAYELNILLRGRQEFCRGTENYTLEEDDVLLVEPGAGHASFAPEPNTCALVLHFSSQVFRPYVRKGEALRFSLFRSDGGTRKNEVFRMVRYCAARMYAAASGGGPYAALSAKAGLLLLLSTLCERFQPTPVPKAEDTEEQRRETIQRLIAYMEDHYAEKIALEDLSTFSQYNRTYISTLFKNVVGINFYEYLTRLRFHHALMDLAFTDKNLTSVALDNGFAELKTFNRRFRETLGRTPAEYRALLSPERVAADRQYVSPENSVVQEKLGEYLSLWAAPSMS